MDDRQKLEAVLKEFYPLRNFFWRFLVFDFLVLAVGIVLLKISCFSCLYFPSLLAESGNPNWWGFTGTLFAAAGLAGMVIYPISYRLHKGFGLDRDPVYSEGGKRTPGEYWWPPKFVGYVEAFVFPVAFLAGKPTFIAAWLALSVAGGWGAWKETTYGRTRFQRFLINSSLSILAAFFSYILLRQCLPPGAKEIFEFKL